MSYWRIVLDEVLNDRAVRRFTNKARQSQRRDKRAQAKCEIKVYKLGGRFKNIHFSRREAECMVEFLRGKKVNMVAEILSLSPRTIEFYLKNMKNKLGCKTKYELINLVINSDFLQEVDF